MAKSRKRMSQGKQVCAAYLANLAATKYEVSLKEALNTDVDMTSSKEAIDNDVDSIQPKNVPEVQTLPINLKNAAAEIGKQRYTRLLNYSRETISRNKSVLAKAAVGSRSIHDFFNTKPKEIPPPEVVKAIYKPGRPDEAALEKIRIILPLMDPKVRVLMANERQCREGVAQFLKYKVVYKMMFLLLEDSTYVEASTGTVNIFLS
ncbi:hypothetical protein INT47_007336 [Mucor saturninus]|uniref:Uncharacterized protein n=1 Tax=Mucor saturninus TaxID=64648 RepID=A0A8H7R9N5_9FUNG|nr:hypothetical protein INT47_007336 [Mucor saturninus]